MDIMVMVLLFVFIYVLFLVDSMDELFCNLLFSFWMKKCNYANASICIRCNELCKCKYLFYLDNI
jgi:hypothetical protein